jgi:hypothetical protein
MSRSYFLTLLLSFFFSSLQAQVQTPKEFLGYTLGETFSRHHQVVDYFKHLEATSSYLELSPYGTTQEGRLLQLAFISSPENLANLEAIRETHLQNSGSLPGAKNDNKSIVWLSYNVHGNESSSTEASMKTAHALITQYQDWLKDTIVIIDPCINPDGRDRYVNFYKQTRSQPYDPLPFTREHREGWQNGRTNHYIFDLNRDWAWLTQKESQQRVQRYNEWLPHIHVDFHEQGINSPYYFAPAAEPLHEVVTDFQKNFQDAIGKNHAKYFDQKGWFYFTKQRFDILYPSYGDSYPMYLGAIGMTYEQAGGGRAGLGINNNENIELTLVDRIEHHYTTGISTVEMAAKNKTTLNTNYQNYYEDKDLKYKNFILEGPKDRLNELASFLSKHQIKSFSLQKKTNVKGYDYQKQKMGTSSFSKNTLVIPTNQVKGKMAHVLMEPKTHLNDSLTYDITAWSLPYAYGLKAMASSANLTESKPFESLHSISNSLSEEAYGYAFSYHSFKDMQFLASLLKSGFGVRYNRVPITNSGTQWDQGSLFILKGDNTKKENHLDQLEQLADEFNRKMIPITTGYSSQGPDLGADELVLIKAPRVGILRSNQSSPYNYGEIWHFFEQQLNYPLHQIDESRLEIALSEIDQLIIPDGYYQKWSNSSTENKVMEWVRKGGKIIAVAGALNQFANTDFFNLKEKESDEIDTTEIPYSKLERTAISEMTTGSIYEAQLDPTHPLSFGLDRYYTLKLRDRAFSFLEGGSNPATLSANSQPVAGFVGYKALEKQKKSLVFGEESKGRGSLIYLTDNVLFRGFWYSGKMIFCNAVFF